ncbi:MAG: sortase [Oscillospiraceae bacterium]|nr:sortase [Oscillospiraceae bacterium]
MPYDRQTAEMEYIDNEPKARQISAAPEATPAKSVVDGFIAAFTEGGNRLISLLSGLLASFLILYSGYVLYDTFYTQSNAKNSWDLLRAEVIDENDVPLSAAVSAISADYRVWLTVYDTSIDYPVLQGTDDLYYATHDIYGNSSLTGSIYLAAGNAGDFSDNYNLIYGHHMDNGAMFGALDAFEDAAYFDSHRSGTIIAARKVYDLNFFAVLETDAYESKIYSVGNRDLDELIAFIQASDPIHFDLAATEGATKIVALSTCKDATTSGRLVLFATMTERTLLDLRLKDYDELYDGESHSPAVEVNLPDGTLIEYSTDGENWSATPPSVRDVLRDDEGNVTALTVYVRAFNEESGGAEGTLTMRVQPREVTVTADDLRKTFGDNDPTLTATVEGTLDGDTVTFTLSREAGEEIGTYTITPTGDATQGNYTVSYETGTLTILPVGTLILNAAGWEGVYDGVSHAVTATVNVPGAAIEYSVDGGVTWTTVVPRRTNVGSTRVLVRAVLAGYETVQTTVTLTVNYRPVTVEANDAAKNVGEQDPTFTAVTETDNGDGRGLLGDDLVNYALTREPGEEPGTYAITPEGAVYQGNYVVTYIPGTLTINAPAGGGPEEIEDEGPPLAQFVNQFRPTGGSHGDAAWALVNLICLLMTAYLLLPLLHLKAKFGRAGLMKKANENRETLNAEETGEDEEACYKVKKFLRRFRIGLVLELVITIAALVVFILTENMRLPMVLIDKWTPLMLILLLACWIVDVRLARYRSDGPDDAEQAHGAETVGAQA